MKPGPGAVRAIGWAAVGGVLWLVFSAYQRPELAFAMATQLWSCF